MGEPILIPFKAEHLLVVFNRDTDVREPLRLALEKEMEGPSYSALFDGQIIACGGIVIPWPGVGMAWTIMGVEALKHRLWITRMTKRVLADVARSYDLHRIEAVVRADMPVNQEWMRLLGFSRENGMAQAYTSDKRDAIRYERV